jgi:pyruvate formate lyase activating enzyme
MGAISPVTIEARYYHKDGEDFICELCPRRCVLTEGQTGFCGARRVQNGVLVANTYGRVSCIAIDPMEKKPLYNYLPRARVFSIGSIGCNMSCRHCQNYAISQSNSGGKRTTYKSPEDIISMCSKEGTASMAFTYNEPGLWFEYIMDITARAPDLKYVMVSNGLLNEAPLKELCNVIDAFNIDLKGFNEDFYMNICGAHLDDVLRSLKIIYDPGDGTMQSEDTDTPFGGLYSPTEDENRYSIGATVTMQEEGNPEAEVFKTTTDEFGDFWFRQVEGRKYHLWFEADGYVAREIADVDATATDANIGRVGLYKMIPLG